MFKVQGKFYNSGGRKSRGYYALFQYDPPSHWTENRIAGEVRTDIAEDGSFDVELPLDDRAAAEYRATLSVYGPDGVLVAGSEWFNIQRRVEIIAGRKRRKRVGSKTAHVCPRCAKKFSSVRDFVVHIESHDWSADTDKCTSRFRVYVESIFLGLASSALWEFVKWSLQNLPVERIEDLLRTLFYLNRPMGFGGRLNARRILENDLLDETSRGKDEESIEYGITGLSEDDARVLENYMKSWIKSQTA